MQALTLPSRRGWGWLADGFGIYRKNPMVLGMFVVGYWMLMMLVQVVPVIGRILATLCIPAFAVSLMNVCRMIEQGSSPMPQTLFSGFHENLRELLILGVIYIVAALAVFAMVSVIDDGALFTVIVIGRTLAENEFDYADFLLAAQAGLALFLPLTMAYWYSPPLAAWNGLSASKAIFFSLVACWRNWRAFLVYSLAILLLGVIVPAVVLGAIASAFGGNAFPVLFSAYSALVLAPTLYASFYVSYRDVFVSVDEDV